DLPLEVIRRRLREAGFRCSKNQFTLLLRNPIYAGRIVVPAWKGEPEEEVQGVHEPLVDAGTFARGQSRRCRGPGRSAVRRRKLVSELPLKGHLLEIGRASCRDGGPGTSRDDIVNMEQ